MFPVKADKVPASPEWIHEIKYNVHRMQVVRAQGRARLISRGGQEFWAQYFTLIVEAALKLREKHFVIDGEVVALDKDGVSDFERVGLAQARQAGAKLSVRHARGRRRGPRSAAALNAQGQPCRTALAPSR